MSKQSAAWRKRRGEIIAQHPTGCSYCGEESKRINVHHRYYESGKKIHEYPDDSLVPLCPKCHGEADELRRVATRAFGVLHDGILWEAIGYMHALKVQDATFGKESARLKILTWEHAKGAGALFGVSAEEIIAIAGPGSTVLVYDGKLIK